VKYQDRSFGLSSQSRRRFTTKLHILIADHTYIAIGTLALNIDVRHEGRRHCLKIFSGPKKVIVLVVWICISVLDLYPDMN